jgi:hypothetical protein
MTAGLATSPWQAWPVVANCAAWIPVQETVKWNVPEVGCVSTETTCQLTV